jgi:hypothetical protein
MRTLAPLLLIVAACGGAPFTLDPAAAPWLWSPSTDDDAGALSPSEDASPPPEAAPPQRIYVPAPEASDPLPAQDAAQDRPDAPTQSKLDAASDGALCSGCVLSVSGALCRNCVWCCSSGSGTSTVDTPGQCLYGSEDSTDSSPGETTCIPPVTTAPAGSTWGCPRNPC